MAEDRELWYSLDVLLVVIALSEANFPVPGPPGLVCLLALADFLGTHLT